MSVSTVTLANGVAVPVVALPSSPGLRSVEFVARDTVGIVTSIFTGQSQTQQWPGADMLMGTANLPPLTLADADNWVSFLMELRGMSNAFLIGDPMKTAPRGTPFGTPVVDNTQNNGNLAMSQAVGTSGWTASASNLLLPGDYIQLGYRLHRVLDAVTSDQNGNAVISIWPSLRETPINQTQVVYNNTQGLFRLSTNMRTWSFDVTRLTRLSFKFQEYR